MLRFALALCVLIACGDDDLVIDAGHADAPTDASTDVFDGGVDAFGVEIVEGFCPGSPGCETGEGVLRAGAASRDITPDLSGEDVQTVDVNGNGVFDPFDGDEFEDRNDNGLFDGAWVAGFSNGRAATGVADPQWVRVVAIESGDTTIAFAAIDCIGWFYDEVLAIREALSDTDLDYLIVAATHTHQARDTMGLWGVEFIVSGIDPDYNAFVRNETEAAVRDALADLRAADVQYASFFLRDMPGGVNRYVSDSRDPRIIDDEVRVIRMLDSGSDDTIATLVNWGSHPQYLGSRNQLLSSDFAHWLRLGIEEGVEGPDGAIAGVGGTTVFVNGAIGSQIGNERMNAETWEGEPLPREGTETARVVGEQVAGFVLDALGPDGGSLTESEAALAFRHRQAVLDVLNRRFHSALLFDLFPRATYNWNAEGTLIPGMNEPDVLTEVAVVDVGRASMVLVPGELDPALFVGGYDGSWTPAGVEIVDLERDNPPDLSRAPDAPYLRDLMRDTDQRWLIGLANDTLGYFVPEFDYELATSRPYFDEAPGDHYEETNSVGETAWPTLKSVLEDVLRWTP